MAHWAYCRRRGMSFSRMRNVKEVSSPQDSPQNARRFWAHRFKSRSGKAPSARTST